MDEKKIDPKKWKRAIDGADLQGMRAPSHDFNVEPVALGILQAPAQVKASTYEGRTRNRLLFTLMNEGEAVNVWLPEQYGAALRKVRPGALVRVERIGSGIECFYTVDYQDAPKPTGKSAAKGS